MKRELRELLRDVARGEIGPEVARRAAELLEPRRRAAPRRRAGELGAAHAHAETRRRAEQDAVPEARKAMWAAVLAWNIVQTRGPGAPRGRCDCGCGAAFRHATDGEVDHWVERSQGGEDTRENGWRITTDCHWRKTNNRPPVGADERSDARAAWNERRAAYCVRADVPFVPRRVR